MRHVMFLDLGFWQAIVCTVGALMNVWFMQGVTSDFNLKDGALGKVKFFHRLAYAAVAMALAYNAYYTLEYDTDPRSIDLMSTFALVVICLISGIRHRWVVLDKQRVAEGGEPHSHSPFWH